MQLNLPTTRGRFGRFGPVISLRGLGACSPTGASYSNTPNGACLDSNTGNIVDCKAATCAVATPGAGSEWSTNAPPASTSPQYQNIPIGGFTGDFQVETLDSFLAGVLAAKESTFDANVIAKGADSCAAELADFQAQAQDYCAINGAVSDCGQMATLVAKYQALYQSWCNGQSAGTYQSADTGNLNAPTNALTKSAPVYTPPPQTQQANVLNPPQQSTNPTGGQQNVTGNQTPASTASTTDITSWIERTGY